MAAPGPTPSDPRPRHKPISDLPGLHRQGTSTWSRLWQPFWSVPAAIIVASTLLGLALPELDTGELLVVFGGGPDGARTVLSSVIGGMISLTGLVFSITIVVLQLASSQFTPRILRTFLDARVSQVTLGVFTGSFVYSLAVLRSVRGSSGGGADFVPQVSVTVAILYVLVAVGLFLAFIAYVTRSIQVSTVINDLARRTESVLGRFTPDEDAEPAPRAPSGGGPRVPLRNDGRQGYVVAVHAEQLVAVAAEHGLLVELDLGIGRHVASGALLGHVRGVDDLDDETAGELRALVMLGAERYLGNDPMFGLRQLVDIAERALSPGVNDPTTAVQVIDACEAVLRVAGRQPAPAETVADAEGEVRLTYRPWTFERLVALACDEIMRYGGESPRVVRTLHTLLASVEPDVRPEHRDVLRGRLERWEREHPDVDLDESQDTDA